MSRRDTPSRSRGYWRAVGLGGVIAAFTTFGPVIPAMAVGNAAPESATVCNAMIIDATAGHVLRNDSAVTQAAAQLQAKGADVRIRVLNTAPDGSLDAYEAAQLAACPSWSLQGGIKPNLLVLLVSLDHQDAIFYGANFSRMHGQVDQIRADMGGDFRSGDFPAGIAKGEQETYSALYPSGTPDWLGTLIILGILGIIGFVLFRKRGGRSSGGSSNRSGYSRYTYIAVQGGSGFSSDGGSSGGSSGSW